MVDVATAVPVAVGVRERIQAKRPQMSSAMIKIADLVLARPAAALEYSITELAEHAGASPATVTRFCRLIGYAGYVPFRVGVASDVGRGTASAQSWQTDIGAAYSPDDQPEDMLRALLHAHSVSLSTTADLVDLATLETIAAAVVEAEHVDVYGIGGSGIMAEELAGRLYRIGINVHAWPEVHGGLTSAAMQDARCVALAISNTGRTTETIQMLVQARSSGAPTVAFTSSDASPLATVADAHVPIFAPNGYLQPDDLSAKHAQLFVLDLLYLLVARRNAARTATLLAASAMAVSGHRRSARPAATSPPGQQSRASASSASPTTRRTPSRKVAPR